MTLADSSQQMAPAAALGDRDFLAMLLLPVAASVSMRLAVGGHILMSLNDGVWLYALSAVLLYPAAEEFVFRGMVQPVFARIETLIRERRWMGATQRGVLVTQANIATSVIFAVVHWITGSGWIHAVAVFFPSLVFGWAWERYGRIGPCIALHAAYNASAVFIIFN